MPEYFIRNIFFSNLMIANKSAKGKKMKTGSGRRRLLHASLTCSSEINMKRWLYHWERVSEFWAAVALSCIIQCKATHIRLACFSGLENMIVMHFSIPLCLLCACVWKQKFWILSNMMLLRRVALRWGIDQKNYERAIFGFGIIIVKPSDRHNFSDPLKHYKNITDSWTS